jgi:hypothetical protein
VAICPISVLIEDRGKCVAIVAQDVRPGRGLVLVGIHMQYCPHRRKRYTDPWFDV